MIHLNGNGRIIGPAIGIDLGTWKCCVGVFRDGKVEIIENERGSKTTPSYVAFTETERIIGEDAKSQVALNPTNTVYGVKRIIGRRFDDPALQYIKDTFPFTVEQHDGKPFIEVMYKRKMKRLCPEQVTAMLLVKMKHVAESHLDCEVKNAVISVPAHFNNAQRQATRDAGVIAGLNVLGLINEPTAAALAYQDNNDPTDETICFVDLGGGTIDVSIIKMEGKKGITVVETRGNTSIGGIDLDQRLVKHFREEFLTKSNHNISRNLKALTRLRLACEKLKHTLSLLPTTQIQLDCLASDTDLESSIARDTFEELCHEDFTESLHSVLTKVLRGSNPECEKKHLERFDRVVLVGGSTRIPHVQKVLKEALNKSLDKSVNPDEAVAHGAAIMAAVLRLETSVRDVVVRDVTTHTFVIENNEVRDVVFQQNSHKKLKTYTIKSENLFNAFYDLFECVFDSRTNTNISHRCVGPIKLTDSTSVVEFTIDHNGIFCGHLVVEEDRRQFLFDSDHLNTEQLPAMEEQEKLFAADEENEKNRLNSLSDLEACCFNKKLLVEELRADGCEVENLKQKFIDLCETTIDWLDSTPEATKDMCDTRKKELEDLLNILVLPPLETNEININTKQQPKTLDQRAGRNSYRNNSENHGGQSSEATICGKNDFQDPLQCASTASSSNWQRASLDRENSADELHQKKKKKKLNDQTKLSALTSSMNKSNTFYQNHTVFQQNPVAGHRKYNNDVFLGRGMLFREDHCGVQPASSVDPVVKQATGFQAEVHKPVQPTASGVNSVNTGHHEGLRLRPPYTSQASEQRQPMASEHDHLIPIQSQGLNTLISMKRKEKLSRDRCKTADSSYEIYQEFSSDEELTVGYGETNCPKKQSHSNTGWWITRKIFSVASTVKKFLFSS